MAILGHAVKNWTEFDAYCLLHGFDPLEVPSRRLVAASWAFLTREMDTESQNELIYSLTAEINMQVRAPTPTQPAEKKVIQAPKEKWRAPEGWTPPGWDEEKSYESALSFMNFQANPK